MLHNDKVIIELDRPRELWFGHKAQKWLQASANINPMELDPQHMNVEVTEQVMFAMLLKDAAEHNEELTMDKVADILDCAKPGKIARKITEAFIAAYAPDEDDAANGWGDVSEGDSPADAADPTTAGA